MSRKMRILTALVLVCALVLALPGCKREVEQATTQAVTKFWAMIIDNNKDQVALTVQGYSTQTNSPFVIEQSDGTNVFEVTDAGAVDAASTADFADTVTFSKGSGDALSVSSGGALNNEGTLDQNGTSDFGAAITCSYVGNCLTSGTTADIEWLGFAAFGNGTPNGVTDGAAEAVYVEGGLEVDAIIYADGAIDADSTSDFADTATFSKASGDALSISGGSAALNNEGTLDQNGTSDFGAAVTISTGNLDVTLGSTTVETMTVGVSGTGADVIFHGDTADKELTWDQSIMQLILDGVNASTVLDVTDGNVVVNDDLTVTAGNVAVSAGSFDVTLGATTVETFTVGANAAGNDAYFYGDTTGKYALWDTGGDRLVIIGVDSATGFDLQDGDALINDDLTVTAGNVAISAGTFDVTLGATTVETMTVGADAAGNDMTWHSSASLDLMLWDSSAVCLDITGTNAQNAFRVLDGNVAFTYDLDVDGTSNLDILDVDGAADFDSTVSISDTLDMTADVITNIGNNGTDFDVNGGLTTASTITVTAGGLVVTAGGLTISDGDAVVADDLRVTAQTAITVTNATPFAATGTYQSIQAAGEVTPTITAGTAGDLLVLINTSAQTINIADTGIQMLSAAWAGGQYDTLTLWCDGTNWLELSRSDN